MNMVPFTSCSSTHETSPINQRILSSSTLPLWAEPVLFNFYINAWNIIHYSTYVFLIRDMPLSRNFFTPAHETSSINWYLWSMFIKIFSLHQCYTFEQDLFLAARIASQYRDLKQEILGVRGFLPGRLEIGLSAGLASLNLIWMMTF